MNEEKTEKSATKSDELFGEVIFIYSKEQAVEDGILIDFGKFGNKGVVFTTNLVNSLEETEIITILLKGLSLKFERPDLIITHINGKKVYIDWNSRQLTFMLPEDY